MFSSESPHRGDSNKYTQNTIFNIKKENQPKFSQICSHQIFSKVLKIKSETAGVNEPKGFEPLKFSCIECMHKENLIFYRCFGNKRLKGKTVLGLLHFFTKGNKEKEKEMMGTVFIQL